MKLWPMAEHTANFNILLNMTGLSTQNLTPGMISPKKKAKAPAVMAMYKLVQNMKSYGLAVTPRAFDFCFNLFWTPPVIPSQARDKAMKTMPSGEEAGPDDFLPMETMQVPPMIAATERYSLKVYEAPPRSREPIITGTIFPDFARVTTGKETPLARAKEVKAFAHTWVAPLRANMSWGRPFVPPVINKPKPPITTFAIASVRNIRR